MLESRTTEADSEPARPQAPGLARGSAVDRFLILGELGHGGMGTVYEAYDPRLDRRIAIKLVRDDRRRGPIAEGRLLREARAMAKLSAPEVVAVFDAGTHAGATFIAMEIVEGRSLEQRLADVGLDRSDVVRWLAEAGRGLAAAHDAGLVHRDFKPANVLITNGGRAKVSDFGIAHAPGDDGLPPGSILGTPRFIPPESEVGPAGDQFAFAITAWRALAGSDPFSEQLGVARDEAIRDGRFAPCAREMPDAIRRALMRALSADPRRRFSSMRELVAQIDRPNLQVEAYAAGIAFFACVGVGIAILARNPPTQPDCAPAGALAIWDDAARSRLDAALAPLGPTGARVRATIDGYAEAWSAARIEACTATRVTHAQSDEAMDLRMACLDERRADLAGFLAAASTGPPTPKLADAAFALPPIARCARVDLLRLAGEPKDPAALARTAPIRERLRNAKLAFDLGRYGDGKPLVDAAVAESAAQGARGLHAEALYWQGRFAGQLGDARGAFALLQSAALAAEAVRADETVASARTALVFAIALQQTELARLDGAAAEAEAAIARIGGDKALTARLHLNRGAVLETGGRSAEALVEFRTAAAGYRELAGRDDPDVARALTNAGVSLRQLGRLDEAEQAYARALAAYEAAFGQRHPQIGATLSNLSVVARARGDHPTALRYAERAVEIVTASLGEEHPTTANVLTTLAHNLLLADRIDESIAAYERSYAILGKLAAGPLERAGAATGLISLYAIRGRIADADRVYQDAQAIYDGVYGADSADAQLARLAIAEAHITHGSLGGVAAQLDRVAAVLAAKPDPRFAPYLTRDRGMLALAEGRTADAAALLGQVGDATFLDPTDAAVAQFALARSLTDRERALTYARRARATYVAAEGERGRNVRAIDAWLGTVSH